MEGLSILGRLAGCCGTFAAVLSKSLCLEKRNWGGGVFAELAESEYCLEGFALLLEYSARCIRMK